MNEVRVEDITQRGASRFIQLSFWSEHKFNEADESDGLRKRWGESIKIKLKEIGYEVLNWSSCAGFVEIIVLVSFSQSVKPGFPRVAVL
jgi:hypothetical protein